MEKKKWYRSKTIWAGVVGVLLGVVGLIDQHFGTNFAEHSIYSIVVTLAGAFGIYGRSVVKSSIG